jgi:hypothetical protein
MARNDRLRSEPEDAARFDAWLRRELEPTRETVDRLVRRSLRVPPPTRTRGRLVAAASATAAVALVAALLLLFPREEGRDPGSPPQHPRPQVEILTITNESGEVEVLFPPPRPREITILNSDGVVAAIVPAPANRHFILGGEP